MYRRAGKGFAMPLKPAEVCRTVCNAGQAGRNEMHQVCVGFGTLASGTQNTTLPLKRDKSRGLVTEMQPGTWGASGGAFGRVEQG